MLLALLILIFLGLVFLGVPIAFSMAAASSAFIFAEGRVPLALVAQRLFSGVDSFPLMAVPFFVFSGYVMDTGGISRRLIRLSQSLVGHIRGGLAMVVTVAEIFFSGISGSTTADISAIGATLIPAMKRAGYKSEQAAAIVAAAASMGVLIPPCIMMVVLGSMVNISVGRLFIAGFIPGFVMALGLLVLIYFQARRGLLPREEGSFQLKEVWAALLDSGLAMLLPVIIFGGILAGVATPTEIAAVAAVYSVIVSVYVYKELDWKGMLDVLEQTTVLTGVALLLIGFAATFSWILASQQVPAMIANAMLSVSGAPWVFLGLSVVVFLFAGVFLEGLPAIIVLMPILLPVATGLGIDPIHYSIVAIGTVGVGIFLPPIGIGILLSAAIAGCQVGQVSRPFMPYFLVLLLSMVLIAYVPALSTWLPSILMN
jgi:C4-dicarboxylate transporter, DctM subunit